MTGHGLHVHAAHGHEIEHDAHNGNGLAQYVAIFTAILATLSALPVIRGRRYHGNLGPGPDGKFTDTLTRLTLQKYLSRLTLSRTSV